ncbi:hypothetical protein GCM10009670_15730 [Citricoccus alkalitolerans]
MLVAGMRGLVTGAAGGKGRATAMVLAREGAGVVVADLPGQKGRLEETAALIASLGVRCTSSVQSTPSSG